MLEALLTLRIKPIKKYKRFQKCLIHVVILCDFTLTIKLAYYIDRY